MSILRFQLSVFFTAGFAFLVHAQEPAEKHPIPDLADREKVEQRIKNLFRDDYAKPRVSDRQALARKLLKIGTDTRDDAVARFVILRLRCCRFDGQSNSLDWEARKESKNV